MLHVCAAVCTWTAAAMPAQQNDEGQQGESVGAADGMDGGVAIGGPVEKL